MSWSGLQDYDLGPRNGESEPHYEHMVEGGEMEFDEEAGELDASFEVSLLQALPKV